MKKFFFIALVLATTVAIGFGGYALWRGAGGTVEDFVDSGLGYYEQEQYSEALIQFLNAVQRDPENREARYLLALTYQEQGNLNAAAQQLQSLLEYFPGDVEAGLRLGNIYLVAGAASPGLFDEAYGISQEILASEPDNVEALTLSGNALAGLQDYRAAVAQLEEAVRLAPDNTAAFISLGSLRLLGESYPEAEEAFLSAREIDPRDRTALMSLGNYYRAVGEAEKAEAVLGEALAAHPADPAVYLTVAGFYFQAGRFDDIERVLRRAQTENAEDPRPSLVLADLFAVMNRPVEARQLLIEASEDFPDNRTLAAKLAANFMADDPDRARQEIDRILEVEPDDPIGQILLGEHQFRTGQYAAAEATLGSDRLLDNPYPHAHFFLGNIAQRRGQLDRAADHYQRALEVDPGYVPARMAYAELLADRGLVADSRREIGLLLDFLPDFVPARLLQARLDRTGQNYVEAERELSALVEQDPNNARVHHQMALYQVARGNTVEAERSLMRALDLQPQSRETLQDLTLLDVQNERMDRAIERLTALPETDRQAFHYELLGYVYVQAGRPQEAEAAYKTALEKDPDQSIADIYLAAQYIQEGRLEDALDRLDAVLRRNPLNASAHGTRGVIYQQLERVEEAKESYREALRMNPDLYSVANNLAYILADEGRDLQSALGWAQRARRGQPDNPTMADTLGWVYYRLGNYVLAREQLLFAVAADPENPVFQFHLGMIYKETGQFDAAEAALSNALASRGDFRERSLAQRAEREIAGRPR